MSEHASRGTNGSRWKGGVKEALSALKIPIERGTRKGIAFPPPAHVSVTPFLTFLQLFF